MESATNSKVVASTGERKQKRDKYVHNACLDCKRRKIKVLLTSLLTNFNQFSVTGKLHVKDAAECH